MNGDGWLRGTGPASLRGPVVSGPDSGSRVRLCRNLKCRNARQPPLERFHVWVPNLLRSTLAAVNVSFTLQEWEAELFNGTIFAATTTRLRRYHALVKGLRPRRGGLVSGCGGSDSLDWAACLSGQPAHPLRSSRVSSDSTSSIASCLSEIRVFRP